LVATLQELERLGVGFVSLTEALDLTTPSGRAMAGMLAVFAGGADIVLGCLRFEIQGMVSMARREVSCRQQTRKLDHVCRCAADIKPRCLRHPPVSQLVPG